MTWREERLADLGMWYGGGTPSKSRAQFWEGGTIPWLSPKDMQADVLRSTQDHITEAAIEGSAVRRIPAGSVALVVRSGILARTIPVALVPFETTLNQDMKAIVCRPGVDPRWIAWGIRAFEDQILDTVRKAGTTVASLEWPRMLNWRLPLPAVEDQRRIVDILEDHLSRLDAANEGIRLAEARLAALSRSWMDGLIWNSRSALVTVSELLAEPMRNGYSARASANGRIRIATLTAVTRRSFTDANSKLTDADPDRVKDLWLEPGDVLVQRANTPELVGSSALYDGARDWAVFPDLLIRLRPNKERVDPAYLCLALQTERLHRTLRGRAKGLAGSMPKVDQAAIGSLLIPVRPIGEQTAIIQRASAHAERADALLRAIQHAGQRSDTLRRALLAAAFSGRLTGRSSDLDRAEEMASA